MLRRWRRGRPVRGAGRSGRSTARWLRSRSVAPALGEPWCEVADRGDVGGLVDQHEQSGVERTAPTGLDDRGLVYRCDEREDHGPERVPLVAGGDDVDRVRPAVEEDLVAQPATCGYLCALSRLRAPSSRPRKLIGRMLRPCVAGRLWRRSWGWAPRSARGPHRRTLKPRSCTRRLWEAHRRCHRSLTPAYARCCSRESTSTGSSTTTSRGWRCPIRPARAPTPPGHARLTTRRSRGSTSVATTSRSSCRSAMTRSA